MAIFINEFGNQTYRGTAAEYDQVDYAGSLEDYSFTQNGDGSVTVFHPNFGTDTLVSIEGFWFQGESRWYSMDDALALSPGNGGGGNTELLPADLDNVALAGQSNAGNMFWYLDGRTDLPQGGEVFESRISELTGFQTEFINGAIPAAASNQYASDRNLFFWDVDANRPGQALLDSVRDIQNQLDRGEDLDALVWIQGESDAYSMIFGADVQTALSNYIESTLNIFDYYRSIFGQDLPIYIIEQGDFENPLPGSPDGFGLIRQAQIDIANNDPNVTISVDTSGLPVWTDGIHFTTEGYGEIGNRLAEAIFNEFTDGGTVNPPPPPPPPPPSGEITGTNGDDQLLGTNGDDVINGLGGQDVVIGSAGNDTVSLGNGYDQVNYTGAASDYIFIRNGDGTITVTKPGGSIDTLEGVDGFWFQGEAAWYAAEALVIDSGGGNNGPITGTNGDDQFQGTNGDDVFDGLRGQDVVFGSSGNDLIDLGADYDQVNYDGEAVDYAFTRNNDGSISVAKPDGSVDTLIGVDGLWFTGEGAWYSVDALAANNGGGNNGQITGTNGDDQLFGTNGDDVIDGLDGQDVVIGSAGNDNILLGDGYDQVNYDGSADDYNIVRNGDGTITVTKPGGSVDLLDGVDGFWFQGEAAWYAADDLALDLFG